MRTQGLFMPMLAICIACAAAARADVLVLKGGKRIEGDVTFRVGRVGTILSDGSTRWRVDRSEDGYEVILPAGQRQYHRVAQVQQVVWSKDFRSRYAKALSEADLSRDEDVERLIGLTHEAGMFRERAGLLTRAHALRMQSAGGDPDRTRQVAQWCEAHGLKNEAERARHRADQIEYMRKLRTAGNDPDALVALAAWCRDHKMAAETEAVVVRALSVAEDKDAMRRRLGFEKDPAGRWVFSQVGEKAVVGVLGRTREEVARYFHSKGYGSTPRLQLERGRLGDRYHDVYGFPRPEETRIRYEWDGNVPPAALKEGERSGVSVNVHFGRKGRACYALVGTGWRDETIPSILKLFAERQDWRPAKHLEEIFPMITSEGIRTRDHTYWHGVGAGIYVLKSESIPYKYRDAVVRVVLARADGKAYASYEVRLHTDWDAPAVGGVYVADAGIFWKWVLEEVREKLPGQFPGEKEHTDELTDVTYEQAIAWKADDITAVSLDRLRVAVREATKCPHAALDDLRPAVADLYAARKDAAVRDLLTLIGSTDLELCVRAADLLAYVRCEAAVPVLIDLLRRKQIADELAAALHKITGQDFGPDAEKWRAWWAEREAPPEPPGG
jgi:hypothetical protein